MRSLPSQLLLLAALGPLGCGTRTALRVPALADASAELADVTALDAADAQDALDAQETSDVPAPDCRVTPSLCEDHNACTRDLCNDRNGQCEHPAITCDDGDPCTANRCDPAVGCVFPNTECGGCADGQREAFRDLARYPDIAACSGGFALQGLAREQSPMCGRAAGDDGPNPNGIGCTASDLCAPSWHVCRSAGEVSMRSRDGCMGASDAPPSTFYASRQTGPGCLQCSTGTASGCTNNSCRADCAPAPDVSNDLFGCGNVGSVPQASCGPLNRSSNNLCSALPAPWRCDEGANADVHESDVVRKTGSASGGVLCCRD